MSKLALIAMVSACLLLPAVGQAADLGVGDKAPALTIDKWIKGEPFDLSKVGDKDVVVVEFWATWCGPCRMSIPHLSELSDHFKGKNVTFIGISDEDEKTVQKFLDGGWDSKMRYRVALDKKRATNNDWMKAANQKGIPTSFVVQGGKIKWIGHPMGGLDLQVAELCGDEAYVKQAKEVKELVEKFQTAMKDEEWKDALAASEKLMKLRPNEHRFAYEQYRILATKTKETERATKAGQEFVKNCDSAELLNEFSWNMMTEDDYADARDNKLAKAGAEKALKLSKEKDAAIIDTYARALFENGDVKGAIEWQEKAIDLNQNPNLENDLKEALEKYKKKASEGV